jgi:soluble lytic murein transglycosylase-like protein
MIEPVFTQLQKSLYQTVLNRLASLLDRASQPGGSLQARSSAFDGLIQQAAQRHDLDPALLKAVVQAESNFSPWAVSGAGAKGLMQLMDGAARALEVTDPFDPAQNIEGGARFLRQLLDRYRGDEVLALAAYNAGPGAVDHWGGVPPYQETETYVPRVLDLRNQYHNWLA